VIVNVAAQVQLQLRSVIENSIAKAESFFLSYPTLREWYSTHAEGEFPLLCAQRASEDSSDSRTEDNS